MLGYDQVHAPIVIEVAGDATALFAMDDDPTFLR
jgi:hypothetical protein